MAVYLIVAISKYCFAGIFRSSCLRDITFMFLKTSECALSHGIWVVTLTYIVRCERQAFLCRILFEILHIIMIVRIVHIYNYMVIIGCQLMWAYPILTELCANRLRWCRSESTAQCWFIPKCSNFDIWDQ